MRRRLFVLGMLAVPALSAAQFPAIAPGTRVRVDAPSINAERMVGVVMSQGTDTLMLAVHRPAFTAGPTMNQVPIPVSAIRTVSESRGRSTWAGTKKGFKLGAVVGLAVAAAETALFVTADEGFLGSLSDLAGLVLALVLINEIFWTPIFSLLGAMIGSETWRPVYTAPPQ